MALYNYKALNQTGRRVSGQMTAANDLDLFQRLKSVNLELISAKLDKGTRGLAGLFAKGVKNRELVQMCLHLQQLSAAGVSLMDGLADVRDSTDHRRLRDLVAEIYEDVSAGQSLSEAFGRHPRVFGTVFQSLMSAGEESGNLTESFTQLIKHLKWTDDINKKIKKAMRGPLAGLVVISGVFIMMMTFVVPQIVGFLQENGQTLPLVTVALLATSAFVQHFWWAIIGFPFGAYILGKMLVRSSEAAAYQLDYYLLRAVVIGDVIRKISLSRFAHFFATMFQSGEPILDCLSTATRVVGNRCLSTSLESVRKGVADGNALSVGLRNTGEFPSLVVRMVKIGEESGNLGDTLNNVTDFYDRDVDEAVDGLVAMIGPLMTTVMGMLIVWIIIAVMGPIYDSLSKMSG